MTGTSMLADAATAAERRASRHRKMAAKKNGKNGRRLKAAAEAGSANPLAGTLLDLNVPPQDYDHTLHGLRFIMRKELKYSDVCQLGRIVLPKKESEESLPCLTSREGIAMVMDDYTSFQMWTFKYRYWPNNRSRMYILENTGDYVKKHNLKIGDFIIIYKDDEKDRYIIRGKKASSTEEAAPAPATEGEGIFDSIMPDLAVDTTMHSDLVLPLSDGLLHMEHDYGQGYDFMQDLPTAPFLEDNNIGSTSFTEPLTPLLGGSP